MRGAFKSVFAAKWPGNTCKIVRFRNKTRGNLKTFHLRELGDIRLKGNVYVICLIVANLAMYFH